MSIEALSPLLPGPLGAKDNTAQQIGDSRSAASSDFDSFLTLLTAQLRNQDPLSPLDSTEFIAQLASFSSVEQLVSANERLDKLTTQSLSGDIAGFAGWIGHDISALDGTFRTTGGSVGFAVPPVAGATQIEAVIRDPSGVTYRTFNVTPDANGNTQWDGLDSNGNPVLGRDVSISLSYRENGALLHEANAEVLRRVTGIRGTADGLILDLADGGSLAPDRVGRLSAASSS